MPIPVGHERQITHFTQGGHDHDGENSTPVKILPGAISLYHLDKNLIDFINGANGADDGAEDGVMPVPDLEFTSVTIGAGGSATGTVPWVGISVVRFMRIVMSVETECRITFYHKPTFAEEDREFRAENCGQYFLWEGAWTHFDEANAKSLYYKIDNTGAQAARFKVKLKSGTMAANSYSRFVESIQAGSDPVIGNVLFTAGNGITIDTDLNAKRFTFSAVAPETVILNRWALTPVKPTAITSSATISNVGNTLFVGHYTAINNWYTTFGQGNHYLQFDYGSIITFGKVRGVPYWHDGRTFNGVKIECSLDGSNWTTLKSASSVWATGDGVEVEVPGGMLARYFRFWSNGSDVDTWNHLKGFVVYTISDKG